MRETIFFFFFFQAEDGIRDIGVTGVQTCALPISMLRQLPSKTEVDNLLVDISQTGLAAALDQKLFQPESEIKKDFYAERPIKIRFAGSYHQFGAIVSGIAALPR